VTEEVFTGNVAVGISDGIIKIGIGAIMSALGAFFFSGR
jgi:hypothetical protein